MVQLISDFNYNFTALTLTMKLTFALINYNFLMKVLYQMFNDRKEGLMNLN